MNEKQKQPDTYRILAHIEQTDADGEYVKSHDDPTELSSGFTNLGAAQAWLKRMEYHDANI